MRVGAAGLAESLGCAAAARGVQGPSPQAHRAPLVSQHRGRRGLEAPWGTVLEMRAQLLAGRGGTGEEEGTGYVCAGRQKLLGQQGPVPRSHFCVGDQVTPCGSCVAPWGRYAERQQFAPGGGGGGRFCVTGFQFFRQTMRVRCGHWVGLQTCSSFG